MYPVCIQHDRTGPPGFWILAWSFCAGLLAVPTAAATQRLPDLFAWEDPQRDYIHGGGFDTDTDPSRALYRFDLPIVNIGAGPFEVTEQTHPDGTQDIFQHIFDTDGDKTQVFLASFPDADPAFGHLYFVGLAQYNLRQVVPGGGVGPIVSSHDKISFGIVDSTSYDTSLPSAPRLPVYRSAGAEILGISVGWADLYRRNLPGQWVDATGLPDGQYWLEVIIDPSNYVLESDDTNNTTRVLVDLTIPDVLPTLLLGDANNDLQVTGADLIAVQQNFANSESPATGLLAGDADDDGQVTGQDMVAVQENFGSASPS